MIRITSAKNDQFKAALSLKQRKHRYKQGAFLIEGRKMIEHAILLGVGLQTIFLEEGSIEELEASFKHVGMSEQVKLYELSKDLFKELCDTVTPQGAMAIVSMPNQEHSWLDGGIYIALDRVQDPGNMGTIIRTADAAGFNGVICSEGTVDPYNEKVLRSTMGSIFSMPIVQVNHFQETLTDLQAKGFQVLCTALENSVEYTKAHYEGSIVIVIGNEGQGVLDDVKALSDAIIKIPIYGKAESLNAAMAAGIVMYEAIRQRTL